MRLRVEGVRFGYPAHPPLLDAIDLEVGAGRIAALLGRSGSGKTTLLRCIAGLETRYVGRVLVEGAAMEGTPAHRRGIGFLFQEPALFPHLDAAGNVAFGLRYVGVPPAKERTLALQQLELVGLRDRADARVDALSGGERQRVALARTLATGPRVVLLDEPLSALDRDLRVALGASIRERLVASGAACVWVTHDEEEARRVGDATFRLVGGRLARVTAPDDTSGVGADGGG